MENPAIAALFDEMADLLELDGAVVFRVRAYRNAARTVRDLGAPLREMAERHPEQLTELPGIGKDLAGRIQELVATGDFAAHRELLAKFPPSLLELLRLPNLGPKRVKQLHDELHITSLTELKEAIAQGRLAEVRGFGARSAAKLREELDKATTERRFLLADAEQWADGAVAYLRRSRHVRALDVAGSLRRRRETIGDLDLLAVTEDAADTIQRFVAYPEVETVLAQGETKASVRLRGGPQVDLRVVAPAEYGAALLYFTGSKAHNIELRKIAQAQGLKLSEYGLFRGEARVAGATEQEVYATLGLDWIPPELREARGEIAHARNHALPVLVTRDDIRGELHAHTDATDGKASLEEMVAAARQLGYRYLAVTDHSKRVTMARGLDAGRLRQQWQRIAELNAGHRDFTILRSVELDILDDGSLDLPDDVLADADYVVASLHYGASKREQDNTARLVAAARHRHVDAIGHPTGRLLGRREAYPLDADELARACADTGCLLELNGSPERMDLPDALAQSAAERGVRFVCSTDAHAVSHLGFMRYAVDIARRAGLTKAQVVNTGTLGQLRQALKRGTR
jgi:DNA polymerase (family 10)